MEEEIGSSETRELRLGDRLTLMGVWLIMVLGILAIAWCVLAVGPLDR